MPSVLPTENSVDKAVNAWGIDTYDGQRDSNGEHGEDSEAHEPAGRSLPDDATKSPQTNSPEEWLSYPVEPESRTVTNLVSSDQEQDQEQEQDDESQEFVRDPFSPDRALAYPDGDNGRLGRHMAWLLTRAELLGYAASGGLPGDLDGNIQHFHPKTETYDARVETVADGKCSILPQEQGVDGRDPGSMRNKTTGGHSEVPTDADNPAARTDYYDSMHPGHTGQKKQQSGMTDYVAPSEDSGAYASQDKTSDSALPTVNKNEGSMDNWLQSLGNWWSGSEIEDVSSPQGFPTTDMSENVDFDKSDQQDGGQVVPMGDSRMFAMTQTEWNRHMDDAQKIPDENQRAKAIETLYESLKEIPGSRVKPMQRKATNIPQVIALTKDFLKDYGKKDLTKRHVLAFLQKQNLPQYLSSDIIRCLKLSHSIFVKDVLDEFPVYRAASQTTVAQVRQKLIDLECHYVRQPEVASVLRRLAADLTRSLLDMERLHGMYAAQKVG